MLPGMKRGPKPSKWARGASAGFDLFFARRSDPLSSPPDEEPLAEVTGAGLKCWIFTGTGTESTQVGVAIGGSVRNVALGVTGALLTLGTSALGNHQTRAHVSATGCSMTSRCLRARHSPFRACAAAQATRSSASQTVRIFGASRTTVVRGSGRTKRPLRDPHHPLRHSSLRHRCLPLSMPRRSRRHRCRHRRRRRRRCRRI